MKTLSHPRLGRALFASVAIGALFAGPVAPAAQAQSITPVVDVCTGLSLDRSLVTDVVGDVVVPVVAPLEATINGLLGAVPILPTLSIDTTTILATAAAGAPLTIQALDSGGTIVGPGNCNLTGDSFQLNSHSGISIGGNAITGLGADGQAAVAGTLDSIAFGNNASTDLAASGAIAFGTGASVTAANGVALGTGSLADRAAMTGYVAPGIAGTVNSAGAVSIGAVGSERQLINVAAATQGTDATNLAQVQGLIAASATPLAVQYDSGAQATVTLGGAGGTTLTNLAPGAVSATSSDAVNGSQLFATNQNVASNTSGIASAQAGVTANAGDIAALDAVAVQYTDASQASVVLGGAGGTG